MYIQLLDTVVNVDKRPSVSNTLYKKVTVTYFITILRKAIHFHCVLKQIGVWIRLTERGISSHQHLEPLTSLIQIGNTIIRRWIRWNVVTLVL